MKNNLLLVDAHAARDAATAYNFNTTATVYFPFLWNPKMHKRLTIRVTSTLDQAISVQIKGNNTRSITGAVNVGSAIPLAIGSVTQQYDFATLNDLSGYYPYLYIEMTTAVQPTAGTFSATLDAWGEG